MHMYRWLRPPRHLLLIFLGTTFAFLGAIGWLGWRSLQMDTAVEAQRVHDRLESSTDLVAAEIRERLGTIDGELTRLVTLRGSALDNAALTYSQSVGEDGLIVVFERDGVRAFPGRGLLYRPAIALESPPDAQMFAIGEAYEDRGGDFQRAALYFQDLASSEDPRIRAGALVRLARNQRKAGRVDAALDTYARLERIDVAFEGRPVELLARHARARLLEELGRREAFAEEARRLATDLHGARWPLTGATYQAYADDVAQWLGESQASEHTPAADVLAKASAVDLLWEEWNADPSAPSMPTGRTSRRSHDRPVFLFWRANEERLVALIGGAGFLTSQIVDPLSGVLDQRQVGLVLADGEGRSLVSYAVPASATQNVLRTMADTRLPWTLRVVSASGPDAGQLAARRALLLAGLGFLALLVVAGAYFSARAMARELEAAQLQSEFVAAVSHEFRTPLTLLRQFSDLLADGRVSSEMERRRYYAALQRGTRRLTRLVEDLLDFGRMEAGSHGFRLEPVFIRAAVDRLTAEFQEEVRAQGYELEVAWNAPDTLVVQADEAALGRALWNLLDNAVKYSPECRTIWVEGRFEGSALTLSVRDRGIGVRADEQQAIFGKFVRGSKPDGHVVKGTGLGLALVRQIVEGHGGTVRVESAIGAGSTFFVTLPAQLDSARALVS